MAEIAIIACDLAEVVGSAIALNLLFNLPLVWGCIITSLDVFIILLAYRDGRSLSAIRYFEYGIIVVVFIVGICFAVELFFASPNWPDVFKGYLFSSEILMDQEALYLGLGIIGATVMPHNLYLHSHIVKLRVFRGDAQFAKADGLTLGDDARTAPLSGDSGGEVVIIPPRRRNIGNINSVVIHSAIDLLVALAFAVFVNSAILIVGGAALFRKEGGESADLFDGYALLNKNLGKTAGVIYAVALLLSGQSSTITGTLAGQIVMDGFLGLTMKPWIRRLLTRSFALVPALILAVVSGRSGLNRALLASQVALSLQLPFAVLPLVYFTSKKGVMQKRQNCTLYLQSLEVADFRATPSRSSSPQPTDELVKSDVSSESSYSEVEEQPEQEDQDDYANSTLLAGLSWAISLLLIVLNGFLLVKSSL